jgi:hypothetical protein
MPNTPNTVAPQLLVIQHLTAAACGNKNHP